METEQVEKLHHAFPSAFKGTLSSVLSTMGLLKILVGTKKRLPLLCCSNKTKQNKKNKKIHIHTVLECVART